MFVTVFGSNKEVLKSFAKEIKTSSLVYPDGKGYFFIQGYVTSLSELDNAFKARSEDMARRIVCMHPEYPAAIIGGNNEDRRY